MSLARSASGPGPGEGRWQVFRGIRWRGRFGVPVRRSRYRLRRGRTWRGRPHPARLPVRRSAASLVLGRQDGRGGIPAPAWAGRPGPDHASGRRAGELAGTGASRGAVDPPLFLARGRGAQTGKRFATSLTVRLTVGSGLITRTTFTKTASPSPRRSPDEAPGGRSGFPPGRPAFHAVRKRSGRCRRRTRRRCPRCSTPRAPSAVRGSRSGRPGATRLPAGPDHCR
ncbi:hypothetical protein SAMN05421854_102248 [Amycolatopsis rubida]|uniref:Uncharacterized protein n=1 Tax=Amycolatopsis rubida TaxID=112413 RepID=A0A1I5I3T3_9PSEU|nr:hypothetical protein SAMN05421854_102248 [Amycolatopsis rubida]